MKIIISEIEGNKSISLLTEIIKICQDDNEKLATKVNELEKSETCFLEDSINLLGIRAKTITDAKESYKEKISSLIKSNNDLIKIEGQIAAFLKETNAKFDCKAASFDEAKNSYIDKISSLMKSKEDMEDQIAAFLEETNATLECKAETLEKAKKSYIDKISSLMKSKEDLEDQIAAFLEETNAMLKYKAETLEEAKTSFASKISSLIKLKEDLENQIAAFLEETNATLECKAETLEKAKKNYIDKISSLMKSKKDMEGQIAAFLEGTNATLECKAETLEELIAQVNSLAHSLLKSQLNPLLIFLEDSFNELSDEKWKEFIINIVSGISETINSKDSPSTTHFKILEKNGWLTKLASLYWWSNESHVKDYVPDCYRKGSMFESLFLDLIIYLESRKININLPQGDFSSKLLNYKADYDEKSLWIKPLFPQYQPDDFLLCEINFLSINSNNGKCTGCQ